MNSIIWIDGNADLFEHAKIAVSWSIPRNKILGTSWDTVVRTHVYYAKDFLVSLENNLDASEEAVSTINLLYPNRIFVKFILLNSFMVKV